eukprot:CAMPEP_0114618252 /NCGR_PEP_ID=MMETSP0168-20121206/7609_1 /TAXON_ID=95228 ORGANISM="Vannella sp., Strain DIVA3 517/6/12" /NCGR_SAMPLE_ID=MMETSP0168 /ASSEMBLY_ACC=CAM_ASM_000044 /LENGTH=327 /DNA_ID=CAMNT_0001829397 /DNA_START=80 /DNA_END=1063 /DNA_ORIENTATION=+
MGKGPEASLGQMALVHGLAGTLGSTISIALTYPLLTVTTRLQVEQKETSAKGGQSQNPLKAIFDIVRSEGAGALYGGLRPALVGTAVSMGIYFYSFEMMKKTLVRFQRAPLGALQSLVVGYVAGCINVTITCPIWVVTACMQAHRRKAKGAREEEEDDSRTTVAGTVKEIMRESGVRGFFKGLPASIILCVNPAIQWMCYEQLTQIAVRLLATKEKKKVQLSSVQVFIVGAIAKVIATILTYPYVMVKSRLQTSKASKGGKGYQYKGIVDGLQSIYATEGLAGLYRGISTKIVQSVTSTAFMYTIKERLVIVAAIIVLGRARAQRMR